jgi:hypothetical protein
VTAAIVEQPPPVATARRPTWDLVIDHVEGRRATLPGDVVDRVVEDMRARDLVGRQRYGVPLTAGNGRDHLVDAYQEALDLAAYLATELDEHGATLDDPIEVGAPGSWRLVRVQAMLWDHVRTIVQLRALIEERSP